MTLLGTTTRKHFFVGLHCERSSTYCVRLNRKYLTLDEIRIESGKYACRRLQVQARCGESNTSRTGANGPDFAYKMQFLYQEHLSLSLVKTMTNVRFSWALSSIASRPFG